MDPACGEFPVQTGGGPARLSGVETIFRDHYTWLNRWLSRRAPAYHVAEDIAAETILRMIRVSGSQAIREPRAMMTTIARRLLIDLRAKNDLERAYADYLVNLPAAAETSAEEQLLVREALHRIESILKTLPSKARSAFLLSQVDGMRHAEIAAVLGMSVSMVRKYIAAGLKACYRDDLGHG